MLLIAILYAIISTAKANLNKVTAIQPILPSRLKNNQKYFKHAAKDFRINKKVHNPVSATKLDTFTAIPPLIDDYEDNYTEIINNSEKQKYIYMRDIRDLNLDINKDGVEAVDLHEHINDVDLEKSRISFLNYLHQLVQSPHYHHEHLNEKDNGEYLSVVEEYLSIKLQKPIEKIICHSAYFRFKEGYASKLHLDNKNLQSALHGHKAKLIPSFERKNLTPTFNAEDYEDKMINVWLPLQYNEVINSPLAFILDKTVRFIGESTILDFNELTAYYLPRMTLGQLYIFDSLKIPHGCIPRHNKSPDRDSVEVRCFIRK